MIGAETEMDAKQMSQLFDINLDTNLDEGDAGIQDRPLQSFDEHCQDVRDIMEHESAPEPEPVTETPQSKDDREIIETAMDILTEPEPELKKEPETAPEPEPVVEEKIVEESPPPKEVEESGDNPLGLEGSDLRAYKEIKRKYPQLVLYDGSTAFKGFYRRKVEVLKEVLSLYPILPLEDKFKELDEVPVDHHVGETYATPDLIRKKLDDSYYCRTRLKTLLMEAHSQLPMWQRSLEMIQGKLWKDHDIKPAHRRDGLNSDHMRDIEMYVAGLKSFLKRADWVDNLLKAAAESLSRQLSCLQLKESTGFSAKYEQQSEQQSTPPPASSNSELDGYDGIGDGEVISAPKSDGKPSTVDFGGSDDEFSQLGT